MCFFRKKHISDRILTVLKLLDSQNLPYQLNKAKDIVYFPNQEFPRLTIYDAGVEDTYVSVQVTDLTSGGPSNMQYPQKDPDELLSFITEYKGAWETGWWLTHQHLCKLRQYHFGALWDNYPLWQSLWNMKTYWIPHKDCYDRVKVEIVMDNCHNMWKITDIKSSNGVNTFKPISGISRYGVPFELTLNSTLMASPEEYLEMHRHFQATLSKIAKGAMKK